MNPQRRAIGALVFAGLIWGTSDVASKVTLDAVPPITLAFLRVGLAMLICWPFALRRAVPSLRSGRLPLLGLIGVAGALLLQNSGLERTSAANGSMLQGAAPILVVIGAAVFLREYPGFARSAGVTTALAGVAVITLDGRIALTMQGSGELYVLGSAACFAAFVILGRPIFIQYGTIPVLAAAYTWAFVFLAPLATVEVTRHGIGPLEPSTVPLLLFLGVGCSALTHFFWGYALRYLDASQAAVFDNMIPIVGIASAAAILRERPTGWELTGGALVIFGAWLASRPRRAETPAQATRPGNKRMARSSSEPVIRGVNRGSGDLLSAPADRAIGSTR